MESYSFKKILSLSDDDIIYVNKDAIYTQILYYERYYPQYIDKISCLTGFVLELMNDTHKCLRIEMSAKDVKENFMEIQNLPSDSFVKYFF